MCTHLLIIFHMIVWREAAERNQVEGKFGQGKRGYGLNDIRARQPST